MTRYASITLLICGDKVWIAKRALDHKIMPGLLECAGGSTEDTETSLDTAVREVQEEACLDIARSRFEYRGRIFVDNWWYSLFFLKLHEVEKPKNTETTKRFPWFLHSPEDLRMNELSPALGALVSIFMQELRVKK